MIILYGALRKQFGKEIKAKVHSVRELMKAAEALRPGFSAHIKRDGNYLIRRGSDFRTAKDVTKEEIEEGMVFGDDVWHVLPMPMGYKGVVRVIVGVVLIIVGAILSYIGYGAGSPIMKFGFALLASGVAELLAPSPNVANYSERENPSERPSYLFNGPTNRTAAGQAVPLVYGFNVDVGSTFISGGLGIGDIIK